ncbi:hypothetical protein [Curtobacterium sp. MCSS17_005]|uniref:hypothetical protein n=1 Tax=Curtobacterium sp. MCSS17_005 TaxID=2175641 RepID=UPI0011B504A3|nr:hypothetical protein [Curtobacterium sp. MCSS17_005]WIB31439.1 hypothetical protein DEJ20_10425 [Curtobacterium sp. MCSS17_005]
MTLATCSALATVIPVLLLGVALEGRSARARLRIRLWYAVVVGSTIVAALALTAMVVVGANESGIGDDLDWVAWGLFWWVIGGSMLFLTWLVSGFELEAREAERARLAGAAKAAQKPELKPTRFDYLLAFVTGKLKS